MANGHGGARPGAGRKRKAERYAGAIAEAEDAIADHLPTVVGNIKRLADGGIKQVEEHFEPAGTVLVEVPLRDDEGTILRDSDDKPRLVKQLAFPDLEPDAMVLVSRKTKTLHPDFKANEYLMDRLLGKPTQAVEVAGEDGNVAGTVVFVVPLNGRDTALEPTPDIPADWSQLPAPAAVPVEPG